MQIDKNLYDEINEYCKINDIKTRDFIHKILREGFMKEKYGEMPFQRSKTNEMEHAACGKIKDLIENQVSLPPDILEVVDEHFFELLGDDKEKMEPSNDEDGHDGVLNHEIIPAVLENPTKENKMVVETPKPKKKRKLN